MRLIFWVWDRLETAPFLAQFLLLFSLLPAVFLVGLAVAGVRCVCVGLTDIWVPLVIVLAFGIAISGSRRAEEDRPKAYRPSAGVDAAMDSARIGSALGSPAAGIAGEAAIIGVLVEAGGGPGKMIVEIVLAGIAAAALAFVELVFGGSAELALALGASAFLVVFIAVVLVKALLGLIIETLKRL